MKSLWLGLVVVAVALGTSVGVSWAAVSDTEISQAQAALAKAPNDDTKRAEVGRLLYLRGSDASMAGNQAGAVVDFKAGIAVIETKPSKIPPTHPVYEELRYGLGYTYLTLAQPQDAVVVLDQLVASSPKVTKGRYLLGIALMSTATEAGHKRGLEVLGQLGKDNQGPDGIAAMHAATRYGYDASIGLALAGKASDAVANMNLLRDRFGAASGADETENQNLLYGMGSFGVLAGSSATGLSEYESLYVKNPGYKLKNGVTLVQVLSNAYYQSGLEQLSKGTPGALEASVAAFDSAENVGGGNQTDTHHGKALAFKQLHQLDKMAVEMATIYKIDSDYYKKINTGA